MKQNNKDKNITKQSKTRQKEKIGKEDNVKKLFETRQEDKIGKEDIVKKKLWNIKIKIKRLKNKVREV